jgi:hypothetical protein
VSGRIRILPILTVLLLAVPTTFGSGRARAAGRPGDMQIDVVLDAAGQGGVATATVRIHARREAIWPFITTCRGELAIFPGLVACDVAETAADDSWQKIRQVVEFSWFMPRLTYEVRANYDKPARVSIELISGNLARLSGSWTLQGVDDYTVVYYVVDLAPAFWVPRWMVISALKRDLPAMLRNLRAQAESAGNDHSG